MSHDVALLVTIIATLSRAPSDYSPRHDEMVTYVLTSRSCNTLGVCHQLSNGFELKHDMLSGDEGVKIKSTRVSSNLNLGNTPLLAYWPFSDIHLSNVEGVSFMCLTSISTHLDEWKSFMKFGIKKSHEMIS